MNSNEEQKPADATSAPSDNEQVVSGIKNMLAYSDKIAEIKNAIRDGKDPCSIQGHSGEILAVDETATLDLGEYSVAGIGALLADQERGLLSTEGDITLVHIPTPVGEDEEVVYASPALLSPTAGTPVVINETKVDALPRLITKTEVVGALAKNAVCQSPYPVPEKLEVVITRFQELYQLPETFGHMNFGYFDSWRAVEQSFKALFDQIPELLAWNTPKHGDDRPFQFTSRFDFGRIDPDADFIDLDALARNIAMDAWKEGDVIASYTPESDITVTRYQPAANADGSIAPSDETTADVTG